MADIIEVAKQNSEKEIQHDDVPEEDQGYEVDHADPPTRSKRVVHYVVPPISHQDLENSHTRPEQGVKVSSGDVSSLRVVGASFGDEAHFTCEELHPQQRVHIHEESEEHCECPDGGDGVIDTLEEESQRGAFLGLDEDFESMEGPEHCHYTWLPCEEYMNESDEKHEEVEHIVWVCKARAETRANELNQQLKSKEQSEPVATHL